MVIPIWLPRPRWAYSPDYVRGRRWLPPLEGPAVGRYNARAMSVLVTDISNYRAHRDWSPTFPSWDGVAPALSGMRVPPRAGAALSALTVRGLVDLSARDGASHPLAVSTGASLCAAGNLSSQGTRNVFKRFVGVPAGRVDIAMP